MAVTLGGCATGASIGEEIAQADVGGKVVLECTVRAAFPGAMEKWAGV